MSLDWKNRWIVIKKAQSVYFSILFGYFVFQQASTKGFTERVCHLGRQSNNSEWNATALVWLYGDYKPIIWHHKTKHTAHINLIIMQNKKMHIYKKKFKSKRYVELFFFWQRLNFAQMQILAGLLQWNRCWWHTETSNTFGLRDEGMMTAQELYQLLSTQGASRCWKPQSNCSLRSTKM